MPERRDEVSYLRGPYNIEFYRRNNEAYRIGAAIHFAHGKQHDVLEKTHAASHEQVDSATDSAFLQFVRQLKARTEPPMELYAPYTGMFAWKVYRAIDWTHMHHEQTYDIMSDTTIPWSRKRAYLTRAVDYYLSAHDVGFSCAPLDVTMRRAGVMMKPYFTLFRNLYPRSNNFFYAAHWWHPAIYEAQMIGGNEGQRTTALETNRTFFDRVLVERPARMLLSREMMPRYSMLDPESANIFDNLHMFHGIVYDIMAYDAWTPAQKQSELYRVIEAMRQQPGDENLSRKFRVGHPEHDPRTYSPWMTGFEGEMNRIMLEMHEEMMPLMTPDGDGMTEDHKATMSAVLRAKLSPGLQQDEHPGSLHDAMMHAMPSMRMSLDSMAPGRVDSRMVDAMLEGWRTKYGALMDIEPWPMDIEPGYMREDARDAESSR